MKQALEPTADASWVLSDDGCDPLRESDRATRFAISNGFLGVRASQTVNRSPQGVGSPNTYVAGLFDTPDGDRAVPELIPVPNGLQVHISLPGGPLVQHFGPWSIACAHASICGEAFCFRNAAWSTDPP